MNARYHPFSILLHWIMAIGLIGLIAVGIYMEGLPFSPSKLKLYNWHKWVGVIALALVVLRLLWRFIRPAPALPAQMLSTMPRWQQWAHTFTHVGLYALMFAVPLLGMAYSSAAGYPVVLFGLWPLPSLVAADAQLAQTLKGAHALAAWAMLVLVVLHVAGALKHQLIDRDGLMQRMLPGR